MLLSSFDNTNSQSWRILALVKKYSKHTFGQWKLLLWASSLWTKQKSERELEKDLKCQLKCWTSACKLFFFVHAYALDSSADIHSSFSHQFRILLQLGCAMLHTRRRLQYETSIAGYNDVHDEKNTLKSPCVKLEHRKIRKKYIENVFSVDIFLLPAFFADFHFLLPSSSYANSKRAMTTPCVAFKLKYFSRSTPSLIAIICETSQQVIHRILLLLLHMRVWALAPRRQQLWVKFNENFWLWYHIMKTKENNSKWNVWEFWVW